MEPTLILRRPEPTIPIPTVEMLMQHQHMHVRFYMQLYARSCSMCSRRPHADKLPGPG